MYQVILVDDEVWSLIGFKKIIEECTDNFEVIYETTDSVDALEKICEKRPDVVFTDVRMPEISGIELIHKVKERGINTEFVVISGFAEFSYVQQAMQEGAVDYQLKPIDKNAAIAVFDRLLSRLEKKNRNEDLELYFLLRDSRESVADLLRYKFGNDLYQKFQVVLVYYHNWDNSRRQWELGEDSQIMCLRIGPRRGLYLINSDTDKTDEIFTILKNMEQEIQSAALSHVADSADIFIQLVNEAEGANMDVFVRSENRIFQYKKPQKQITSRIEEVIDNLYGSKKYQQIEEVLADVPQLFMTNNMGAEDALNLYNRTALLLNRQNKGGEPVLETLDIFELTESFADIEELCSYLCDLFSTEKNKHTGTVNEKFYEMLHYIDRHYAEDLSLKDLCSQFYINMSYCCELFKKHSGKTFSQYLTDIRINKACDLLRYHGASVSEACDKVGYKDYFYFNRVFKKKIGCTPAEYRKNENQEN